MGGGRAARARTLSSSTTPWPHLRQAVPPVEGGQDRPRRALMARAAAPAAARQPGVRNRKARPLDICDGRRGRAKGDDGRVRGQAGAGWQPAARSPPPAGAGQEAFGGGIEPAGRGGREASARARARQCAAPADAAAQAARPARGGQQAAAGGRVGGRRLRPQSQGGRQAGQGRVGGVGPHEMKRREWCEASWVRRSGPRPLLTKKKKNRATRGFLLGVTQRHSLTHTRTRALQQRATAEHKHAARPRAKRPAFFHFFLVF